jgi:hypothetical protein
MEQPIKKCVKCDTEKLIDKFRQYHNNSFSTTCKKCLNEMDKQRKKAARKKKLENCLAKCEKCDIEKSLIQFAKLKKFYKKKICLECYPIFLKEQKNNWCETERVTNMNYRIKKSLAARLRNVLYKNDTTMNYIGCNIQYLREWFEFNFTEEMSWDNYGSYWSIDHIIPVCKFDLTNETEKYKCWNWSNMMPTTVNKKCIQNEQINYIMDKIEQFKEKGSTTKWFSSEFILDKNLVDSKLNIDSL